MAFRFTIILSLFIFAPATLADTGVAVAEGHNDISCEPLPTGDGGDNDVEQVDLSQVDDPATMQSEHYWRPEWTQFAMECMDQYGLDITNPSRDLPDDYREYCGGEIREHVSAERRLLLLSVLVATARYESGFNPETVADLAAFREAGLAVGENQSEDNPPTGLFQMGQGDCPQGGSCDMTDPRTSICAAVKKANDQIVEDNVFAGCKNSNVQTCRGDEWGGLAAYWEVHRTMETNEAIYKTNAIKNAVRNVCGCNGIEQRFGGVFANAPQDWLQAAMGRPALNMNPITGNTPIYSPGFIQSSTYRRAR